MKKHIKKIVFSIFILFCCYCIVDAVIETQQKIFPIQSDEINYLSIGIAFENREIFYFKSTATENDTMKRNNIVDAINALPMHLDEESKNEIISDFSVSPYEKPVMEELCIGYSRNFLQRKCGTTMYFYEDGSFMVSETGYQQPLLIRYLNQWNYENWDYFEIYTADDMDAYHELLAMLKACRN